MNDTQELISTLQTIPWFQELNQAHFDKLVEISELVEYDAGQELYRQGDKQEYLYIVITGRVAVEIAVPGRGRQRINTAEAMDVLGWSSATPVVRLRTSGAVTVLPTQLVRMDAVKLRQLCEENHSLGYVVMKRLANVVASSLLVTRLQLLDMFAHDQEEGIHD